MRFTCEKSMLSAGLSIASRTVAQKSSLSVLEGILCRAGHGLTRTGYNMETAITHQIDAEVTEAGQCILPARLFGDIIRRLPEGPVTVTVDMPSVAVSVSGSPGSAINVRSQGMAGMVIARAASSWALLVRRWTVSPARTFISGRRRSTAMLPAGVSWPA